MHETDGLSKHCMLTALRGREFFFSNVSLFKPIKAQVVQPNGQLGHYAIVATDNSLFLFQFITSNSVRLSSDVFWLEILM
jgi:hypothetical protein